MRTGLTRGAKELSGRRIVWTRRWKRVRKKRRRKRRKVRGISMRRSCDGRNRITRENKLEPKSEPEELQWTD